MANAEFETKWAAAPSTTTPNGATATALVLISGVATQVLLNNLVAGKVPVATPASAGATGTAGQISISATHVYLCVATDTWVRGTFADVGLATW
jgi:hypothetical protein